MCFAFVRSVVVGVVFFFGIAPEEEERTFIITDVSPSSSKSCSEARAVAKTFPSLSPSEKEEERRRTPLLLPDPRVAEESSTALSYAKKEAPLSIVSLTSLEPGAMI